jgi:hypothetical protein
MAIRFIGGSAPKPDPHYRLASRLCRDDHRRIASYATSPSAGSISTISTDLTSSVSPE